MTAPAPQPTAPPAPPPLRAGGGPIAVLRRYVPRHRRALLLGGACLVVSQLLGAYAPQVLRGALSTLEAGARGALPEGAGAAARAATWLAAAYVLVVAAQGVGSFLTRRLLVGVSRRVERDLKRDVFGRAVRLPAAFFDRMRTGDLLSRLSSDVEAVRFSVGPGVMYLAQAGIRVPAALAAMLWMDAGLTLLLVAPLAGIAVVVRLLSPSVLRHGRAVQDRLGDLSARAQENFAGARVVRAYATEDGERAAFRRRNEDLLAANLGLARSRATLFGGLRLMGDAGLLVVVWYGGTRVLGRHLDHGTLVAFLFYLDMLLWPMISLGYVLASFQRAASAMARLDEVLSRPEEPEAPAGAATGLPATVRGALSVRGLTFAYPDAPRAALEDVSIEVPAGTTLALVGPVGSGKSTLAALLVRSYPVPDGTVFLDGVDVNRVPLARLRRAFAFVPQDPFLFSDTIRSNLAYGLREPPAPGRLEHAADVAGLAEDLPSFPNGLDTVVGERGVTLSGGQKQRATIARALAVEAPVLVLDDAASAVDTRTEARILDALREVRRSRTAVIVAHRLSTVRDADQVVVLDAGRVVERGTHDELIAHGGWYARTWGLQRLHAEIEDVS